MAKYAATYRDETHTYRLSGAEIVMLGADGLEHGVVRDTPEQARKHLKALIQMGSLRKTKPPSALRRVEGQKKTTKTSIPQNRR